jgi:glycosyltransferase involved in cell wall biosynthesis
MIPGLHFRFVRKTRFEQFLAKIPGMYYIAYRLWHRRAFQVAKSLHEEVNFDLVHQVNLCGYREPGKLGQMQLPFIWGPIGGTQNHPWMAIGQAGLRGGIQESIRSIANSLQLRFSRRVRRAATSADLLLVANSTNQSDFERILGKNVPVLCETGSPAVSADAIRDRPRKTDVDQRLRLLWAGNLHAFKALPLLLQAISKLPESSRVQLRIVGDGPQHQRWRRMANRLGISHQIEWIGRVRDLEMQTHYTWADVFVFTSLRDTSGNVIFEALASGVPVLAADHQGVGDIVTAECGIKVSLGTPADMATQYRNAIVALATDKTRLERLSAGALRRAAEYAWPEQGERMRDYYRQVLGNSFVWERRVSSPTMNTTEQTV